MKELDPVAVSEAMRLGYDLTGCHEYEREDILLDTCYDLFAVFACKTEDESLIDTLHQVMSKLWNNQCDHCGGVYFREYPKLLIFDQTIDPNTFEVNSNPPPPVHVVRFRIKGKFKPVGLDSPFLKLEGHSIKSLVRDWSRAFD